MSKNFIRCMCNKKGLEIIGVGQLALGLTVRGIIILGSAISAVLFFQDGDVAIGAGFVTVIVGLCSYDMFEYRRKVSALVKQGHTRECSKKYALAEVYRLYSIV